MNWCHMSVGDLVVYYPKKHPDSWEHIGVVLYINNEGGTVKVQRQREGDVKWWVTSGCKVII